MDQTMKTLLLALVLLVFTGYLANQFLAFPRRVFKGSGVPRTARFAGGTVGFALRTGWRLGSGLVRLMAGRRRRVRRLPGQTRYFS